MVHVRKEEEEGYSMLFSIVLAVLAWTLLHELNVSSHTNIMQKGSSEDTLGIKLWPI